MIVKLQDVADEVCAFADDVAVIVSGNSWEAVERRLNSILTMVGGWAQNNALNFNADKSAYIQYSWQRTVPNLNVFMNHVRIKRETKI